MSLSLNSLSGIKSAIKCQNVPRSFLRHDHYSTALKASCEKINICVAPLALLASPSWYIKDIRWCIHLSATDGSKVTTDSSNIDSANAERAATKLSPPNAQSNVNDKNRTAQTQEATPLRSALTAREKLRAARVLSKYTDSKPAKVDPGSKVLDALKESERGKKKSGLPEAPMNLFDDSKRGMPKQGLTFDFPGGADLFFVLLSFVLISTIMFATTYFVWKVGAIHFNEY